MKIRDVIRVPDVPTVVQLAEVERLKADLDEQGLSPSEATCQQLRGYVEQYFLVDPRTKAAVQTILHSLATGQGQGGAFFVKGLYGSGKSHLLAVLSLLAEHPLAWEYFLRTHPEFAQCADRFLGAAPLLVVSVALDEYSGRYTALEDIVFDEAERSLRRPRLDVYAPLTEEAYALELLDRHVLPHYGPDLDQFLRAELHLTATWGQVRQADASAAVAHAQRFIAARGLPFDFRQSRVERLGRLLELVAERGLRGVVLLIDELSVFLSAKGREELHNDASFLQFLGQRTRLSPLWVVATLQKNVEDVGDIEHYTLAQIKDRFNTRLSLGLTEVRHVIARKLIEKPDPAAYQEAVAAAHEAWTGGQRIRTLTKQDLELTYPLHPATLTCLEACADHFLSKTRSLIDFVLARVRGNETEAGVLDEESTTLVTPDAIYDHFARELGRDPALARYVDVAHDYYARHGASLFARNVGLGLRLIKLLIVYRLAGLEPSVREIAAALLPAQPEGQREKTVLALLETMRTQGSYVDRRPRRGEFNDLYVVDLEFDVNETIRRRLRAVEETLAPEDGRVAEYALASGSGKAFHPAAYRRPTDVSVQWLNTTRTILVAQRDLRTLSGDDLVNQAALLASFESEEAVCLWLGDLFHVDAQRAAWEEARVALGDERWGAALLAWLPRPLDEREREQLRQHAAHALLAADPTLADHRLGERLLERLDEGAEARRHQTFELVSRAYYEGEVLGRKGVLLRAEELMPLLLQWDETLALLAGRCFERLFPQFRDYAPRRRVFSRACANELINDFIAVGGAQVSLASTLGTYILDYAIPLGVAAGEEGRFRVHIRGTPLVKMVLNALPPPEEPPLSLLAVEQLTAKSEFGLVPELTHILAAALIKKGYAVALDDEQRPLPVSRLGAPLRAHVAALRAADVLPAALWEPLRTLAELLLGKAPSATNVAAQQSLWEALLRFRADLLAQLDRLGDCVSEVQRALGHDEIQWLRAAEVTDKLHALAATLNPDDIAAPGLARFVAALRQPPFVDENGDWSPLRDLLAARATLAAFAEEHAQPLLQAHHWLHDPRLRVPDDSRLASQRRELLKRFAQGDEVAFHAADLRALADHFQADYVSHYVAWHRSVHAPSRFEPYLQLKAGPAYQLLERLSQLRLDAPRGPAYVDERIRQVLSHRCRVLDLPPRLAEAMVCPECGLAYGEKVELRPVAELEHEILTAVQDHLLALRAPERAALLRRAMESQAPEAAIRSRLTTLLDATQAGVEELLEACSPATLDFINSVLATRAVATRQLSELVAMLANKNLTKRELLAVFREWLDAREEIGLDDYVTVEWAERVMREALESYWA